MSIFENAELEVHVSEGDGKILATFVPSADLPPFNSHFPGNPITPGVLTLQMVCECLSRHLGRKLHYAAIKNCRFAAIVRPGDYLRLNMQTASVGGTVKLKADLTGSDNPDDLRVQIDAELQ